MINNRNIIILSVILIISVCTPIILILTSIINLDADVFKTDDFHYNMITFSTVIAGFLFTSLGILISSIGNDRIGRLWEYKYLDNIPRSSMAGIICNMITLVSAFILIIADVSTEIEMNLITLEVICSITSIMLFIYCVIQLLSVIDRFKKQN